MRTCFYFQLLSVRVKSVGVSVFDWLESFNNVRLCPHLVNNGCLAEVRLRFVIWGGSWETRSGRPDDSHQ